MSSELVRISSSVVWHRETNTLIDTNDSYMTIAPFVPDIEFWSRGIVFAVRFASVEERDATFWDLKDKSRYSDYPRIKDVNTPGTTLFPSMTKKEASVVWEKRSSFKDDLMGKSYISGKIRHGI